MNIYLICTGNTCRSPMAEAILRSREIENVTVRSAGINAFDGIPISEHAKTLIENADMPYTETSRRVTVENVEWADYVLTMTDAHKHTLLHLFPQASQKIYTLKGFIDPVADENVQDPYGGNLETYTQTFEELLGLVDDLERKLRGDKQYEAN